MISVSTFREFLFSACGYERGQSVLAGVSGGVDSVVLCDLLREAGIPFSIAHVNYRLRGDESDGDENFVRALAEKLKVRFYVHHCDEQTFTSPGENSVQPEARNIRYDFFHSVSEKEKIDLVAVAHHFDDSIETALLNFARGTGIRGLHGIAPKRDQIIRPLLFATRDEITEHATSKQLAWREDSSNATDNYSRNRFRRHLLPWLMHEIPQGYDGFRASFSNLDETEKLLGAAMEMWKEQCCIPEQGRIRISIPEALNFPQAEIFLHAFLRPFGFVRSDFFQAGTGAQWTSGSHRLIRDREQFFLVPLDYANRNRRDHFYCRQETFSGEIPDDKWTAIVDAETIHSPLEARTWTAGDKMIPFGMKGHRNVSDILNDLKLPLHEKENAPVIVSGDEIVWIPGYRIADKFRVRPSTTAVIRLFYNREEYAD